MDAVADDCKGEAVPRQLLVNQHGITLRQHLARSLPSTSGPRHFLLGCVGLSRDAQAKVEALLSARCASLLANIQSGLNCI